MRINNLSAFFIYKTPNIKKITYHPTSFIEEEVKQIRSDLKMNVK